MTWLEHLLQVLGIDDTTGPWYAFWSGFGGIMERLIELLVLAGILLHKLSCETHRCWRPARHPWTDPTTRETHRLCRKHHPLGPLTAAGIKETHHTMVTPVSTTGVEPTLKPVRLSKLPVPKVTMATFSTLLASFAIGGLNAAEHSQALGGLPGWAQFLVISLAPPVVAFIAGYATPGGVPPVA